MTLKLASVLAAAGIGVCAMSAQPDVRVHWSASNLPGSIPAEYVQTFTVTGDLSDLSRLAFNQFARRMETVNPADTLIEIVPGYYAIGSSRFNGADSVSIDLRTRGTLRSICYGPDGVHAVNTHGMPYDVTLSRFDLLTDSIAATYVPDAESIFLRNEALKGELPDYPIIPAPKQIDQGVRRIQVDFNNLVFTPCQDCGEGYRLAILPNLLQLSCDPQYRPFIEARLRHYLDGKEVTAAVIEDTPDFAYRGLMLDIARNFQDVETIKKTIDLMSLYGLNTLHFHPVDDEAWRLEIRSLPELTQMGSRRGYTANGSTDILPQIFAGNGDPDVYGTTANGYISREQFIDLLQYAAAKGVSIIPEIESPGHARAAIQAMKNRPDMQLAEEGDTSRYTSAQSFHDNVMNPGLPGPYRFMETVFDEIIDMYAAAGVPLKAIHIGGDEVPRGAWSGSPAVAELMQEQGLENEHDVHAYFVQRISNILKDRGVPLSGWQEVAINHPDEYNSEVSPNTYSINCWTQSGTGITEQVAANGFPFIISNVNHFYLDMCYSPHPYERGLSWGGYVDEFNVLGGYADSLVNMQEIRPLGVQGQIFAETLRSADGLFTMMLPKLPALAERAWNSDLSYTEPAFNALINSEIPGWLEAGIAFHVRQPGARVTGNKVEINSSYPAEMAVIRYTLDGTEPTPESEQVSGFELALPEPGTQLRLRQWIGPNASASTLINF